MPPFFFFFNKLLFNLVKLFYSKFWSFFLFFKTGAQMEVDYSEKLNFSDDEENQGAKEKRDNW